MDIVREEVAKPAPPHTLVPVPEPIAGAVALLDERAEAGWRDRIDLNVFNIGSASGCVLGQLAGSRYSVGLRIYALTGSEAYRAGFVATVSKPLELLNRAWREYLIACRDADAAQAA